MDALGFGVALLGFVGTFLAFLFKGNLKGCVFSLSVLATIGGLLIYFLGVGLNVIARQGG